MGERVGELDVTDETDEDVVDVEHGEVDKSNDLSLDWFFILLLLLLLSRNDFGDNGWDKLVGCCWFDVVEEEEGEPVFVLFKVLFLLWLNNSFSSLRHFARRFENQT